ncbi:hypothetical protein CC1G_12092 [Coprinopsis cinerea okayama7|uniref:Uncharacterized protein n=1 Tax=Coprinopsis cinerea (strain Okayama-7 / 130 / ATCC MYA-4618 / FGSC 9003) TaxID=240176 RepID=A8N5R0_COPC7|nr:hypothetical protein CC1G_12092 [Coprinopsis cinerea okayama7\|eukprot:XP_001830205.2 hypothetical protein CC1G_12092 [Coprinopsis cinerea okayama7\
MEHLCRELDWPATKAKEYLDSAKRKKKEKDNSNNSSTSASTSSHIKRPIDQVDAKPNRPQGIKKPKLDHSSSEKSIRGDSDSASRIAVRKSSTALPRKEHVLQQPGVPAPPLPVRPPLDKNHAPSTSSQRPSQAAANVAASRSSPPHARSVQQASSSRSTQTPSVFRSEHAATHALAQKPPTPPAQLQRMSIDPLPTPPTSAPVLPTSPPKASVPPPSAPATLSGPSQSSHESNASKSIGSVSQVKPVASEKRSTNNQVGREIRDNINEAKAGVEEIKTGVAGLTNLLAQQQREVLGAISQSNLNPNAILAKLSAVQEQIAILNSSLQPILQSFQQLHPVSNEPHMNTLARNVEWLKSAMENQMIAKEEEDIRIQYDRVVQENEMLKRQNDDLVQDKENMARQNAFFQDVLQKREVQAAAAASISQLASPEMADITPNPLASPDTTPAPDASEHLESASDHRHPEFDLHELISTGSSMGAQILHAKAAQDFDDKPCQKESCVRSRSYLAVAMNWQQHWDRMVSPHVNRP